MEDQEYFVYIMARGKTGTLYVGMTYDLEKRVYEHKHDLVDGFTKEYGVHRLVYYEFGGSFEGAWRREHRLKRWNRAWKIELIESVSPGWLDLAERGFSFPER